MSTYAVCSRQRCEHISNVSKSKAPLNPTNVDVQPDTSELTKSNYVTCTTSMHRIHYKMTQLQKLTIRLVCKVLFKRIKDKMDLKCPYYL